MNPYCGGPGKGVENAPQEAILEQMWKMYEGVQNLKSQLQSANAKIKLRSSNKVMLPGSAVLPH